MLRTAASLGERDHCDRRSRVLVNHQVPRLGRVFCSPLSWYLRGGVSTAPGDSPITFPLATRVGDLDDVLPILLSGLVLATMAQGFSAAALWLAAQAGLIALVIALAGWLLVAQASAVGEQQVFVAGTLLLLGGTAAYLSMSALWVGLQGDLRSLGRSFPDARTRQGTCSTSASLLLGAGAQLNPPQRCSLVPIPALPERGKARGRLARRRRWCLCAAIWPPSHRPGLLPSIPVSVRSCADSEAARCCSRLPRVWLPGIGAPLVMAIPSRGCGTMARWPFGRRCSVYTILARRARRSLEHGVGGLLHAVVHVTRRSAPRSSPALTGYLSRSAVGPISQWGSRSRCQHSTRHGLARH